MSETALSNVAVNLTYETLQVTLQQSYAIRLKSRSIVAAKAHMAYIFLCNYYRQT